MLKVGFVKHYFEKTSVAIIQLNLPLAVWDKIIFNRNGKEISGQVVESILFGHRKIESAQAGQVIGLTVKSRLNENDEVYKI